MRPDMEVLSAFVITRRASQKAQLGIARSLVWIHTSILLLAPVSVARLAGMLAVPAAG